MIVMRQLAGTFAMALLSGLAVTPTLWAQGEARPYQAPYSNSGAADLQPPTGNTVVRPLRRNPTPSVSPLINLLPEGAGTLEQQWWLRTVPQEDFLRSREQTQRSLRGLQSQISRQTVPIQSGLSGTTGRRPTFMNRGAYFGGR
jgi:hypothetical protein